MALTPTLKRIQMARTALLLDEPFFGVLALGLDVVEDPSCPTAWTDGQRMGFSPAFVARLSNDELKAVIAHEVMHCACGHPWRRDAREMRQWNYACDYAINPIIADAKMKLPAGCLNDPQYAGKSAEWIYARLPQQPQSQQGKGKGNQSGQQGQQGQQGQPGSDPGGDPGGMGEVRDAPAGSADHAPTEADWQQQVQGALKAAKARGKLPAALQEKILDTATPHVDWTSLLRRYVQEVVKADYSWSRPNVRYIPSGLYLPALHSHACGRIAIAVDTSGSIDTVLLAQFAAEIRSIADELQPSAVDVLYCDARVHRVDHFERGDLITIEAVGRGGTSFAPVFERIDKDGDTPAVLIYLTDLDGSFPDHAPDYPVIWAAYGYGRNRAEAPFGDVVPCE